MAGQGRLDRDLGGLEVPDLTDHDDIGILPQKGTQCSGKVEADIFVHLHLVDTGKVEFHRIFGGGDILGHLVQFSQGGIQRNRFPGTGGPGHQHHAERFMNLPLEVSQRIRLITQFGQIGLQVALVQQTQDDLFAKQRRQA